MPDRREISQPRFDGVDILRGLSILAVVLLHTTIRMRGAGFKLSSAIPPLLSHFLFWNGNNGVTVFFAISGFLITLTSIRRFGSLQQIRPNRFYRIRFARIAPLLLLVLAVLSALHLADAQGFVIQPQRSTLRRALFAALTFHLNWHEATHGYLPANWDVLWSLSIEETFYLGFPIACLLLLRLRGGMRWLIALLLLFVALAPFGRTIWGWNDISREKAYLGGMDCIALGCLTALLANRILQQHVPLRARSLVVLQCIGAAMMLLVTVWPPWPGMKFLGRSGLDGTVLALGTCCVILATVLRSRQPSRWTAPVRWFGRHSYEVYMTHEFIVIWGTMLYSRTHAGPLAIWYIGILLLTAPLGALVARYFSEPLNRRLRQQPIDPTPLRNIARSGE